MVNHLWTVFQIIIYYIHAIYYMCITYQWTFLIFRSILHCQDEYNLVRCTCYFQFWFMLHFTALLNTESVYFFLWKFFYLVMILIWNEWIRIKNHIYFHIQFRLFFVSFCHFSKGNSKLYTMILCSINAGFDSLFDKRNCFYYTDL